MLGLLPNITGSLRAESASQDGVFSFESASPKKMELVNNNFYGVSLTKLNGNRASSLYGGSSTVQPASAQTLIIIKF